MPTEQEAIYSALNQLMNACGLSGESGTERLFPFLLEAVEAVEDQWDRVVGQSHKDGLCFDVNALLAEELTNTLQKFRKAEKWAKQG